MTKPSIREKLRYRSDRFFQSGFTLQLFISAIIVIAVITLFYLIAEIAGVHPGPDFGVQNGNEDGPYWPSVRLWWVIMHVMESYWLETGTFSQILSIFLTLFNFLVFAAIVGLVGSRIQQRLEQVKRGTSRVIEEDHIVILGWSGKVIPIIQELHDGLENGKQVYVIASELPIDDIETRLRKRFSKRRSGGSENRAHDRESRFRFFRSPVRWVIRQGSSTDLKDLELLGIERARDIIILRQDTEDGDSDVQVVKTIMAVAHIIENRTDEHNPGPGIIAEISGSSFLPLAEAAARRSRLSVIQPSDNLSKIILQTARQEGLVEVYDELLSHRKNEIHFTAPGEMTGRTWEEVMFSYRSAIPIGVFRYDIPSKRIWATGETMLAPAQTGREFRIGPNDSIIMVARSEGDMHAGSLKTPQLPPPPQGMISSPVPIRNVLILGWNEKIFPLLKEYAAYGRAANMKFSATIVSPGLPQPTSEQIILEEIATRIKLQMQKEDDLLPTMSAQKTSVPIEDIAASIELHLQKEDYLISDAVERLGPENYDAIIVLDEEVDDAHIEDADNRVMMTLLLLRSLREKAVDKGGRYPERQQIVGEMFDVSNKELAKSTGTLRDVIISNDLVSKLIAQVCRERRTEPVMKDMFDEEGKEIYIKSALHYAQKDSVVSFDQLLLASLSKGEVAIGYVRQEGGASRKYELNPARKSLLTVDAGLQLIVIAEDERS